MEVPFWKRAPFAIAGLLAVAAAIGIGDPTVYARETRAWALQGRAQDWIDLLVVAPVLVVAGWLATRGSSRARFVLAGAFAYVAYSYAVYAVGVHFNQLFLIYCALVGFPAFALLQLIPQLPRVRVDRQAATALLVVAAVFAALWLGQILPAMWRGATPAPITDAGLPSNPVYVLDLALVLPAMAIVGSRARRGDPRFAGLVWALLAFAALMVVAIAGILFAQLRG